MTSGYLLSVRQLEVSFVHQEKKQKVIENLSFDVAAGETFALVGESGSGKSVTAHSILKLLPAHAMIGGDSRIYLRDQELLGLPDSQMNRIRGKKIGMIFQEPMTALNPLHTVEKQLGEIIGLHRGLRGEILHKEVLAQLERVQIAQAADKLKAYPHQLSGGQRQRVMIAMALANEPELLIADEPTTALDVTVQKQIMLLLKNLQQEIKMAMLLITHDLGVVKHFADKVAVMHRGRLVEQGMCSRVLNQPEARYTRELLDSEPGSTPVAMLENTEEIMTANGLSVRFPLNKPFFRAPSRFLVAVDNVNVSLLQGTTLGVVGESGSGKSTLAMALLRLQSSTGSIQFKNQEFQGAAQKSLRNFRKKIQIVFQDPFASLSPRMTVQDIIAEGLRVHTKMSQADIESAVLAAMDDVGLNRDLQYKYPHEFSGGQRQRIAIARALILKPEIVFLDEPTSALDRAVQVQILNLLRGLQAKYQLTYVFISHDLKVIKSISHYIVVIKDGKIIEEGKTDDIFFNPQQPYTKMLLNATLS